MKSDIPITYFLDGTEICFDDLCGRLWVLLYGVAPDDRGGWSILLWEGGKRYIKGRSLLSKEESLAAARETALAEAERHHGDTAVVVIPMCS